MRVVAAAVPFALTAAAPATHSDPVSLFRCGTQRAVSMADWANVEAAFRQRSVNIIAASLANDTAMVRASVSPDVQSVYFPHDAGVAFTGATSVIKLIRDTAPRDYEWLSGRGLPPPLEEPCATITISLTLLPANRGKASIATFKYQGGLLVELRVNDADYATGHFRPPRP